MLDYPIYKHLKQFSTLVDAMGNLTIQSPTINELEEQRKLDLKNKQALDEEAEENEDSQKEGGEQEKAKEAYEGGDSENGTPKPNG